MSTLPLSDPATGGTYLILGVTGGIGAELCRGLAQRGAKLALGGRDGTRLRALADELSTHAPGCETECIELDATKTSDVERAFTQAIARFGPLDGVANCVGSIILKPAHLTTDADFETTLRLNLWSSFGVVKAAGQSMREKGGSVVLFSTAAARTGLANHEAVAAAKAGVIGLAQSAAATYAAQQIRFNVIAPGLVRTPLAKGITGNELALKASESMHALGRIGEPSDIAPLAAWLLSRQSAWTTGQVFGVDGGLSTVRPRPRG